MTNNYRCYRRGQKRTRHPLFCLAQEEIVHGTIRVIKLTVMVAIRISAQKALTTQ